MYYCIPYSKMFDIDLGSMVIDFRSVESDMIHSRSFLLHYFFIVQQSRAGMTRMVQIVRWFGKWSSP